MIPESLKDLYHLGVHGGDNLSLRVLADAIDEAGHPLLATVFRRGAGYREKFGVERASHLWDRGPFPTGSRDAELDTTVSYEPRTLKPQRHGWVRFRHPTKRFTDSLVVPLSVKEFDDYMGTYGTKVQTLNPGRGHVRSMKDHPEDLMNLAAEQYRLHHVNTRTGEKIPFKDHPRLADLPKETLESLAEKVNREGKTYNGDWEARVLKLAQPGQSSVIVRVPLPQPVETPAKPQAQATTRIQKSYVW